MRLCLPVFVSLCLRPTEQAKASLIFHERALHGFPPLFFNGILIHDRYYPMPFYLFFPSAFYSSSFNLILFAVRCISCQHRLIIVRAIIHYLAQRILITTSYSDFQLREVGPCCNQENKTFDGYPGHGSICVENNYLRARYKEQAFCCMNKLHSFRYYRYHMIYQINPAKASYKTKINQWGR